MFDAADDFGTELGDFLVGEGTLGAPQGNAEREATHAFAEISASIDVEEFDAAEGIPSVFAYRGFDGLCGNSDGCDEGEVLASSRVARDTGIAGDCGVSQEDFEVEFCHSDAHGGDVEAITGFGV